jgi:hypothetical protein
MILKIIALFVLTIIAGLIGTFLYVVTDPQDIPDDYGN